jgi:GNAT superfamily N-acetyltransferase
MAVIPLPRSAHRAAAALIARAFANDPLSCYMFPDGPRRARLMEWVHRRWFRVVEPLGGAFMTDDAGGVAVWWPPHAQDKITLWRILRAGLVWTPLRVGFRHARRMRQAFVDHEEHARAFRLPHWYLDILAVDPDRQGCGVGAALIRHVTRQADRDGLPCYVATHNPRNIPYYERFGFRVLRETRLARDVHSFSLERFPRP